MAPRKGKGWEWVFNPLVRLSTRSALAVSLAFALGGLVLSLFRVRFDGALDMHLAPEVVPLGRAVVDVLVAWPLTAAVFWAAARLASRGGRYVDFLGAVGLARVPLVLLGVLGAAFLADLPPPRVEDGEPKIALEHLLVALSTLPLVGWCIALLVLGYRSASGLRGARLVVSFLGALVVAEAGSKLLLWLY